jgi:DNA-binding transcriptional MerR regulator
MAEMRIDELARRAGVPTRTIRYYTQQGLLNPPTLRGRVGFYDDQHLERLRLIKELQEKRYLPLSIIHSVIRHYESGTNLETMLAPLDIVFQPRWDATERKEFTRADLAQTAGVDTSVVDAAEEMGFLFPTGRGRERRYTQDDVHMLEVAQQWLKLGLPKRLGKLYRESLEEISQMQVRAFNQSVVAPLAKEQLEPDVARERLLEGYQAMANVFNQLVALLHRKVLQKSVESFAADDLAADPVTDRDRPKQVAAEEAAS